jgi:hypothetical protein
MLCILHDSVVWDRLTSAVDFSDYRVNAMNLSRDEIVIVLDAGAIHKNFAGCRFFRVFINGCVAYAREHKCVPI